MAPDTMPYPVNLDLTDQPVLVVGGGTVAARKVETLVQARARVTVIAPRAVAEIADRGDVRWQQRPYRAGDAAVYRLAVTATDDPEVNALVAADGAAANVFVNSADDPANCTFTLPSVARRGDIQVAVSTNGRSPALARWLRQRIEHDIDFGFDALIDLLGEARRDAQLSFGTSEIPGWQRALNDGLLELVRAGDLTQARDRLRRHLELDTIETRSAARDTERSDPQPVASAHNTADMTAAAPSALGELEAVAS